jgi:serine/threonine protein kinase
MRGSSVTLHTSPTQSRAPEGSVCPKCHKRFDATGAPEQCPDDGAYLLWLKDLVEAKGDPMLGRTLDGRFTILARLGNGSMGTVYRARQHNIGRDVAIKILRSDRALDEAAKARFLREARANSVLVSPHTVTVFDFGQSSTGELFLAMELLDGESLGQRLARVGRLPAEQAVDVARQALRSLAEAHAKGIIHRDLKPDNLFFARVRTASGQSEEIVKVLDFGIAKMFGEGAGPMNAVETQAGTVFGTPRYMSPEQAQAKPLDARSDLYALGVILYHMLCGRPPFTDDDAIIVMARHIKSTPKTFAEACPDARLPRELEAAVMRAMAKDPAQRPPNADAMSQELLAALELAKAGTSGVRASMSGQLAPILSLPPPPPADDSLEVAAVAPRKRSVVGPVFVIGGFVVAAIAAAAATVALRARSQADVAPKVTVTATAKPSLAPTTSEAPPALPVSATPASTDQGQTVDVSSLPTARPTPSAGGAPRGTARASAAPPPPSATVPPPEPTTTGSGRPYGMFE